MSAMKKMLADFCPEVLVVGEATCIKDALLLIVTRKPELAFLDIQLPDGNSFALVNALANSNTRVIFTTAYNDYALKALKCAALDYLLKPVNIDELIIAIGKYKTYREQIDYSLSLKVLQENMGRELKEKIKTIGLATINEIIFVETDLIIRLEAASNYTHFFIEKSPRITVSHTLKYYEDLLDTSVFMRVHQSNIINLRKVKKYIRGKTGSIVKTDGCTIDVSPRKKDEFLKALNSV